MQHPGLVDLIDGPRDRRHQLDRDTRRQRAADAVRQASPGDQVEDEVETAVLFARFVELDDVAMADPPDRRASRSQRRRSSAPIPTLALTTLMATRRASCGCHA